MHVSVFRIQESSWFLIFYKMSKLERMIDIIDTMLDGRRRTGVELSYKYGVCRNTIYRDISQLSKILPIVTYYGGRNGGSELLSMNSFKYGFVQKSELRYLLQLLEKETDNPQAQTLIIKMKNCFKFLQIENE